MRPETTAWWTQAEADLKTATIVRSAGQHYATSWFCQQAAEKGLKAIFVERLGNLPPRTHDLEYLGKTLNVPDGVQSDLTVVNPAFDLTRYPDTIHALAPSDIVTESLARQHLEAAERVIAWCRTQIA